MDSSRLVDRRSFIRKSGGAVAGGGLLWLVGGREALAARPGVVTRYPLYVPPVVSPDGLTLLAAPSVEDLGGGSDTIAWTYNGSFPGPTLLASTGDVATIHP